ncbi:DUF2911 domain-containing protein [Tenacibaculum geojense]|uniref:DUF2911 domain-containing protein n=1 Tax=Tenacibaculum geojense TaxID=915352 RepID=A0ABW3JSY9_9FLAO
MKKLILSLLAVAVMGTASAQVSTPQPSPLSKLEQKVGLTDVTVEYSRPGMRGRTIFGDLVPYGKLWRTGANANTVVTFSNDVKINGVALKKGKYAVFTKPSANQWEVIFYTDTNNWGTPRNWDDAKVALKTTAKVEKMPMKIETFTITLDDLTNNSAVLGMLWENSYAGVKFEVPTDKEVSASIEKVMAGPGPADYFASASYYLEEGKDINQAVKWIDKAVDMTKDKPRFWYLRKQSLIHAKAGNKKGAIKAAKESLKYAEKAGNADYIKMNKDSLKEWGA